MLNPEFIPVYEKLYSVLTGIIVLIAFVSLFILLIFYLPSHDAMKRLKKENDILREQLTKVSNLATVTTLEKNFLASEVGRLIAEEKQRGDNRIRQISARAETFAEFGDKCRKELLKYGVDCVMPDYVLVPAYEREGKKCCCCGSPLGVRYKTPKDGKYYCSRCILSLISVDDYMSIKEETND